MTATVTIASNLHVAALDAAYFRVLGEADGSPVPSSRLAQLIDTFSLSRIEEMLLLVAAAADLAPAIPEAARLLDAGRCPSVRLAYERFGRGAEWLAFRNALRSDSALCHWHLLTLSPDEGPLPDRTLTADPRIVDFLLGGALMSSEVSRVAAWSTQARRDLQPRNAAFTAAMEALRAFLRERPGRRMFFVLAGGTPHELEEFAQTVLASVNMPLLSIDANLEANDRTLVLRESLLTHAGVLVHGVPEDIDWYRWLARSTPIIFLARRREQGIEPLQCPSALHEHAWVNIALPVSRVSEPHRLSEFAQRIPARATWADLIVLPETRTLLQELCAQGRLQDTVLIDGGFGRRLFRGRGTTGLFCGPSGTGKTLAAEVIAHELGRELYRVDLARVVSKYIGETEKSLRRIFDEAERARCVLFYDEADALFGKRTEVRDSHDRYSNLEVSYLLQLFEETEHAVVLLATNRRQAIDEAFARRFRFVVEFTMPTTGLRDELWRSSFTPEIAVEEPVRIDVLADRLPLTGASIRNIALAAAFLAVADHGKPGPVSAVHILQAARREFEKLSSPMPLTVADLTAQKRVPR